MHNEIPARVTKIYDMLGITNNDYYDIYAMFLVIEFYLWRNDSLMWLITT